MANELGLDYEHLPIEIGDAGARAPEFLAINPNGRLPFIDDNGFVLFESLAITLYLAKKHSNGKLYPGTLEGEAAAWQWSFWAVTEVDRGVNIWSLHAVRLPPAERDAAKRDEALKVLVAPFKVLDAAVASNPICSAATSRWLTSMSPPPDEPAAERAVFHGLRVAPKTSLKVLAPAPNSGVFDLA